MPDLILKNLKDVKIIRRLYSNESELQFKIDSFGTIFNRIETRIPEFDLEKSKLVNYPICKSCGGYFYHHSKSSKYILNENNNSNNIGSMHRIKKTLFDNQNLIADSIPVLWPNGYHYINKLKNKVQDVIEAGSFEGSFNLLNQKGDEIFSDLQKYCALHPRSNNNNPINPCSCMIDTLDTSIISNEYFDFNISYNYRFSLDENFRIKRVLVYIS